MVRAGPTRGGPSVPTLLTRSMRGAAKAMPEDARRHNRSLVLQSLFRDGPLSRADLARATRLTPTSASDLVAGLLDEGLVEEVGRRAGQGVGKPATLVGIIPDARHVVTLDLSADEDAHGAVVDLTGKVLHRRTVPRHDRVGQAAVDLAVQLARELVATTDRPILGIGVGSPGVVDTHGVVTEAANLGWHDVALARHLEAALGLPVHVANDANMATLAEFAYGDPAGENLLLVKIGEGVGAGLLIDGELFTGDRFAAGEIGHVTVDERGDPCACGRRGCLETAVAVPLLRRRMADALDDRARARVLEAAGRRLGLALATVVSALNLDDVVLSGPADVLGEPFREAALATIRRRTIPSVGEHVSLRYDSLGDDDVLLGAAVLVLNHELGVA
jgi:predicted NBD/HSP70 family sugar kinase